MYGLVIQNAKVFSPPDGYYGEMMDIGISDGRVMEMGKGLSGEERIEARGLYASPGFIDIHCHSMLLPDGYGVDDLGIKRGASMLIEAGTSAFSDVDAFRKKIKGQITPIKLLLGVSDAPTWEATGSHPLPDAAKIVDVAKQNSDIIAGLKITASASLFAGQSLPAIELAQQVKQLCDLPLTLHIGNGPPYSAECVAQLQKGDILTHTYHGKPKGLFGEDGTPCPELAAARVRGVLVDVGHGAASFNAHVAKAAFSKGFFPDLIGTDIYGRNMNGPVYSLPMTMSKMMALGMTLEQCVTAVTATAAKTYGLHGRGRLQKGERVNITLFSVRDASFPVNDSDGNIMQIGQSIIVDKTILSKGSASVVYDADKKAQNPWLN